MYNHQEAPSRSHWEVGMIGMDNDFPLFMVYIPMKRNPIPVKEQAKATWQEPLVSLKDCQEVTLFLPEYG